MKFLVKIILISCVLSLLLSCSDSTSPNNTAQLNGKVTDPNGNPVENAKIFLNFKLEELKSRPSTSIHFNLVSQSNVNVTITKHNDSEIIRHLVNEEMLPGSHLVEWNCKDDKEKYIKNDIYDFIIVTETKRDTILMPILEQNYNNVTQSEIDEYIAYASTDKNGIFAINYNDLPQRFTDLIFTGTDAQGNPTFDWKISNIVDIWALHPEYNPTFSENVIIDKNDATNVEIEFE